MFFLGKYKGVSLYTNKGRIHCQFGWVPKEFQSTRAAKCAITKWRKS